MITEESLKKLIGLAAAATPGEREVVARRGSGYVHLVRTKETRVELFQMLANVGTSGGEASDPDTQFQLATSPDVVTAIAQELLMLRKEIDSRHEDEAGASI